MSEQANLRPIAVIRPLLPRQAIQPGRGINPPAGLLRSVGFVAALTADRGLVPHLARRSLGFARSLGVFGGRHHFATSDLALDLRRRPRRRSEPAVTQALRWPVWQAPPSVAIPARHEGFIGLPVLPDEAVASDEALFWGWGEAAVDQSAGTTGLEAQAPGARPLEFGLPLGPRMAGAPRIPDTSSRSELTGPSNISRFLEIEETILDVSFAGPRHAVPRQTASQTSRDHFRSLHYLPVSASNTSFSHEPILRILLAGEPERGQARLPLVRRRSYGERPPGPAMAAGDGLAAVRRMRVVVDTAAPMISVANLGARVAAQHAMSGGATPFAIQAIGATATADRPVRTSTVESRQRMPLAAWRGIVGADRRVRPLDRTVAGPAASWSGDQVDFPTSPRRAMPQHDLFPGIPEVREGGGAGIVFRSIQEPQAVPSPDAPLPGSVRPSERVGWGMTSDAAPYLPRLALATIAAPTSRWSAPTRAGSAIADLAADIVRRAAWQPSPTLRSAEPAIARRPTPPSETAAVPTLRSMTIPPLPNPLVAPLPPSTLPAPSREPTWRSTTLPNLLAAPPVAGPAELPMVSRRLAFGVDRMYHAASGTVSPVWGPLGQFVTPTGAPVPASGYAAPFERSAALGGGGAGAGASGVSRVETPARPFTGFVWAAPMMPSPAAGQSPGSGAAPSLPTVRPVVFRSPLPDRAEPTELQRAQAAEAMAASTGQPLPPLMRRSMEHLFGMDLAAVRVHAGPAARRAADLVGARAMASGTDVFLPGGIPETPAAAGTPLLAHELTHVAHHLGHRPAIPAAPMTLARRVSSQEREADAIQRTVEEEVQRFPLPGGLPQSAMTLARPLISQAQSAAQSAIQDVGEAVGDKLPIAQIKDALAAVTGAPAAQAGPNPAEIAEQVYQMLERRLLVERERAGIRR